MNGRACFSAGFGILGRAPLILLAVVALLSFVSCNVRTNQIRRMQQLEEGVSNPVSIEEIEDAIQKYEARVEDIINAEIRVGNWYKILGTRYLDSMMYGKALENFRAALEYYPTNQNLFYYVGVCAGHMAHAALDFEASGSNAASERYLDLAEAAYLRAIELEPRYMRALYGLSVLYVFEKDEPEKAIPYLELATEIEKRDFDALTILARAYYSVGETERAVAVYDRIISETRDEARRAQAEQNKAFVLQAGADDSY